MRNRIDSREREGKKGARGNLGAGWKSCPRNLIPNTKKANFNEIRDRLWINLNFALSNFFELTPWEMNSWMVVENHRPFRQRSTLARYRGGGRGRGRGQQKRGKRKAKFFDQKFQRLLYIKLGNKTRLLPFRVFHSQDSQQFSRPAPSISMGGGSGERSNANRFNIVSRARRKITNVRFRFSFEETWKKEEGEGKLVEETIFPPFSYL